MSRVPLVTMAVLVGLAAGSPARSAEGTYPFEGSWVRADRTCAASPTRERVYTAHDVTSSRGRCAIRKIASVSGTFELFERCERPNEKPNSVREIIRLTGPDTMTLTRQTERLKLSRTLRFARCPSTSATPASSPTPSKPAASAPAQSSPKPAH